MLIQTRPRRTARMPKLAIYVPKNRMKDIERWRRRINFSQVFMDALAREIREQTRAAELDKDKLAAAARHYQRELAANCQPLVDCGFKLGSEHVADCRLKLPMIERLTSIVEPDALSSKEIKLVEDALGSESRQVTEYAAEHGYDDKSHPTWRTIVYGGYLRGVSAAWQQVCEKMRS